MGVATVQGGASAAGAAAPTGTLAAGKAIVWHDPYAGKAIDMKDFGPYFGQAMRTTLPTIWQKDLKWRLRFRKASGETLMGGEWSRGEGEDDYDPNDRLELVWMIRNTKKNDFDEAGFKDEMRRYGVEVLHILPPTPSAAKQPEHTRMALSLWGCKESLPDEQHDIFNLVERKRGQVDCELYFLKQEHWLKDDPIYEIDLPRSSKTGLNSTLYCYVILPTRKTATF